MVKISNTEFIYLVIGVFTLVGIAGAVYALSPGVAPNPGHTADEVAPPANCQAGQLLRWTGTAWQCSNLDCKIIQNTQTNVKPLKTVNATCDAGYHVTGGGCVFSDNQEYYSSHYPSSDMIWTCTSDKSGTEKSVTAYAICCR